MNLKWRVIVVGLIVVLSGYAQNPIIQHIRTADPSAHVWNDGKLWVYTSHDVTAVYNEMDGYHAFSTTDMKVWKDHGEILHSRDIPWGVSGYMWAPTAAYRNGKHYLIYPHSPDGSRNMRCGVAVSDVPEGPFKDIGWIKGVESKWLDPCVFEDADGSYYLYWGVDTPYVARLKENMIELAESPRVVDYGAKNFFEAAYMHQKDGKYYYSYNAKNAGGDYSMGDHPYGPFVYVGPVLKDVKQDHHSIIEYHNQWYLFYHWQNWNDGGRTQRNVAVESLYYNEDGTIKPISPTEEGIAKPRVTLVNTTEITDKGLYFDGVKNVDYRFSSRITPHGDCIDAIGDYVFFTWYKGGMDKRNLMLSRMKIGSEKIVTIAFPDRLIGFRGDSTKGDSHNTASVGICALDQTIHLMYDMHVYSQNNCPTHAFNYRISIKNAATVPDSLWTLDLFYPKQNYLKKGVFYENITYPQFVRVEDGHLLAKFRIGGAGNGDNMYALYDGDTWSDNIKFNNGNQPKKEDMYSIYGGFQYLHGILYSGFSVRYAYRQDEYIHNNGIFLAAYRDGKWCNSKGVATHFPLQNPVECKVGEPCELGLGYKISGGTNWTVTENGSVHFVVSVSGNNVHYYKSPTDTSFVYETNTPFGSLFSLDGYVYAVNLIDGHLNIFTTPEGKNEWTTIYKDSAATDYRHFNIKVLERNLFVYLMENKSGDAQPLVLSSFLL